MGKKDTHSNLCPRTIAAVSVILVLCGTATAAHAQESELSVFIEQGQVLPAHTIELRVVEKMAGLNEVHVEILAGEARFMKNRRSMSAPLRGRTFSVPELSPGHLYDETTLSVSALGRTLYRLRTVTLPVGGIEQLLEAVAHDTSVVLQSGPGYALVNEQQLNLEDLPLEGHVSLEGELYSKGLCVRVPWGPGKVDWNMSNPSSLGYSVKPETSSTLIWASGSSQDIDGIYNKFWGCGDAFKVPDSCTADVYSSGTISCCCNAAMMALGHVCKWVNPGSIGWANCPLF